MAETICLITAPVSTDYEDPEDHASRQVQESIQTPKLGVLALAATLEQHGFEARILDLDRIYSAFVVENSNAGLVAFADHAAERIAQVDADLFGFSTLCSSYPLTLRVTNALKQRRPRSTILLGGPQASVVDTPTMNAFASVDFVLRGEADLTLPLFVEEWTCSRRFANVPGLTYRSPFGVQRNPDAPVIDCLDTLPLPAYHLTGELKNASYASLELGRGCPFSCTFCSTNDFFRRKFRVKAPARMLADMRAIADEYGIRSFNLVHDMFTVDRRRVVAFCEALIVSGEGFTWSCSARTDCVDDDLLELMARAGCCGIFFGVEAGSERMQKVIDKGLDPAESRRLIETADRAGIGTTVALMTGFPEETEADLNATAAVYMHSLRHVRSSPQLNILAPLAGTPLLEKYRNEIVLEELCSDASHQGRKHNEADRALIRKHPEIFPNFYLLRTPGLDRDRFLEFREFLLMASERLRWLAVALHRTTGVLRLFDSWREFRNNLYPQLIGWSMRHYYMKETSRKDFVQFLENRPESRDPAVKALLSYHRALIMAESSSENGIAGRQVSGRILNPDIPVRRHRIHVLKLDWDIQQVIEALKKDQSFSGRIVRKHYRTEILQGGVRRLVEITPLVASALQVCDGNHTVADFTSAMADHLNRALSRELLRSLRDQEAIAIYR